MRNIKLVPKILVTSGLVACLMALMAAGAWGGAFKVNGQSANGLLATLTGLSEGTETLLVPGRNLTLKCTDRDFFSGSAIELGTHMLVILGLLDCKAFSHTTGTSLPCTVSASKAPLIGLPKLHNGKAYILFEPDAGSKLETISLEGESCPLPEENPVTGCLVARLTVNNSVVNLIKFEPVDQTLLGAEMKFGGFAASVYGEMLVSLTGTHAGLTWGIS